MGKTRKWLRNLLMSRKKHKGKDKGQCGAYDDDQISSSVSEIPTPKEKRRWSFRRPPSDSKQLNNSAETNVTAASAAIDAHQNLQNNDITDPITEEEDTSAAVIKIQSVFRSYLARKALSALRGTVKLQALVRGQLARKQASATLRCMQALLTAQARACAHRIMIASEAKFNQKNSNHTRRTQDISLMISHVCESDETDMESEENIRIVKVDFSGSKENARSRNNTSEQSSPASEKKLPFTSPVSVPNYMANTESSRAKFRSHSEPKQRPFERQLSRPKASLEARNSGHRPVMRMMRRSSSHAQQHYQYPSYQYPSSIKLDRSSVSLIQSECGSTSTVLTNTQYCRSLVLNDPHEDKYY